MHSGRVCLMHASLADVAALSLGDTLHARHQSAGGGFLWGHTLPRTRGRYRQHPSRLSDLDHLRAPVPSHRRSPEQVCAPGVANSRTSSGTSSCYCRHSCDTRLIHASLHRGRRPLAERARAQSRPPGVCPGRAAGPSAGAQPAVTGTRPLTGHGHRPGTTAARPAPARGAPPAHRPARRRRWGRRNCGRRRCRATRRPRTAPAAGRPPRRRPRAAPRPAAAARARPRPRPAPAGPRRPARRRQAWSAMRRLPAAARAFSRLRSQGWGVSGKGCVSIQSAGGERRALSSSQLAMMTHPGRAAARMVQAPMHTA